MMSDGIANLLGNGSFYNDIGFVFVSVTIDVFFERLYFSNDW